MIPIERKNDPDRDPDAACDQQGASRQLQGIWQARGDDVSRPARSE